MHEVTPDLIAEIATRLFNDTPQSPTEPTVVAQKTMEPTTVSHGVPMSSGHMPSGNTGSGEQYVSNSSFIPSTAAVQHPSAHAPHQVPQGLGSHLSPIPVAFPTEIPSDSHAFADVSPEGLRRFVDQIRNPQLETPFSFCPAHEGSISSSRRSHPGAFLRPSRRAGRVRSIFLRFVATSRRYISACMASR